MSDSFIGEARFDFGHVVGQTFGLIGRNFLAFVMLALIFVGAPRFGIMYFQSTLLIDRPDLAVWALLVGGLVTLVTTYILQGALTRASVDDLSKKGVSIGAALGDGLRYFFPLFIVALLVGLGTVIGLLFFIIPGLILIVRWAVAAPAALIEREGPTHSIGRSAELTEGHRWAVFGLILLYLVFFYASIIGLGMVLAAMGNIGSDAAGVMTKDVSGYIYAGAMAGVETLTSLVATVGMASLYFELRRVKDGVGVDELAKVFD
jgi:hypothetical protein